MSKVTMVQARLFRDDGMTRAKEHADAVEYDWSVHAYQFVSEFARVRGTPFLAEDARVAAEDAGIECPTDNRAWGQIIHALARAGRIKKIGAAAARTSNCSLKPLWQWIS
jgi:hypothetical protein